MNLLFEEVEQIVCRTRLPVGGVDGHIALNGGLAAHSLVIWNFVNVFQVGLEFSFFGKVLAAGHDSDSALGTDTVAVAGTCDRNAVRQQGPH